MMLIRMARPDDLDALVAESHETLKEHGEGSGL
jgi:hypothetical protein